MERHEFFFINIKRFNDMADMLKKLTAGLNELEVKLIEYDNAIKSVETRYKDKEAALSDIEKRIVERKLLADAGSQQVREQLNKKHLELIERETKIKMREQVIAETQMKAERILAAAEGGEKLAAIRGKKAVAA